MRLTSTEVVEEIDAEILQVREVAQIMVDDVEFTTVQKEKCLQVMNRLITRAVFKTRPITNPAFKANVLDGAGSGQLLGLLGYREALQPDGTRCFEVSEFNQQGFQERGLQIMATLQHELLDKLLPNAGIAAGDGSDDDGLSPPNPSPPRPTSPSKHETADFRVFRAGTFGSSPAHYHLARVNLPFSSPACWSTTAPHLTPLLPYIVEVMRAHNI
jgi:hypothetical protein